LAQQRARLLLLLEEEGSPLAQLARRAQRLHSVQVLAQQLVGLVVVVGAAKEGVLKTDA
jgi:hypothetical protein